MGADPTLIDYVVGAPIAAFLWWAASVVSRLW